MAIRSVIIVIGRVTNFDSFDYMVRSYRMRKDLHYVLIKGKEDFENNFPKSGPFWECNYLKFKSTKIIKDTFKNHPKWILYIKVGDGPERKKVLLKDFTVPDQMFYQDKIKGAKCIDKTFGSGNDKS